MMKMYGFGFSKQVEKFFPGVKREWISDRYANAGSVPNLKVRRVSATLLSYPQRITKIAL